MPKNKKTDNDRTRCIQNLNNSNSTSSNQKTDHKTNTMFNNTTAKNPTTTLTLISPSTSTSPSPANSSKSFLTASSKISISCSTSTSLYSSSMPSGFHSLWKTAMSWLNSCFRSTLQKYSYISNIVYPSLRDWGGTSFRSDPTRRYLSCAALR
jgi:hypothetical protein